jgi:hypothetical protein
MQAIDLLFFFEESRCRQKEGLPNLILSFSKCVHSLELGLAEPGYKHTVYNLEACKSTIHLPPLFKLSSMFFKKFLSLFKNFYDLSSRMIVFPDRTFLSISTSQFEKDLKYDTLKTFFSKKVRREKKEGFLI